MRCWWKMSGCIVAHYTDARRRRVIPGPAWGPMDAVRARECEEAKVRAEGEMARFELRAAMIGVARARLTPEELRAGPLLTDRWGLAPSMAGIGRRLGRLTVEELEDEG